MLVLVVGLSGMGLLLATRSPAPRIRWLLLLLAFGIPDTTRLLIDPGVADGDQPWWARLVIALTSAGWVWPFAIVATIAFIFPTDRPATVRWRRTLRVSAIGWLALYAGIVTSDNPGLVPYEDIRGPFAALPEAIPLSLFVVGYAVTLGSLIAAVASVVVRYRRSRGIERLQLKWLALVLVLLPLTVGACATLALLGSPYLEPVGSALYVSLLLGVTVAVALAITRYRLYQIDVIINRTLVYGASTALLAGLWVGIALGLGVAFGRGSAGIAAVATALVALGVVPLRRRLQDIVDRRFARARHEALAQVRAFEEDVRTGRAQPGDIEGVLRTALGDPAARLLLRLPHGGDLVSCKGDPGEGALVGVAATPVGRDGREIGLLLHDPELELRPELLRSTIAAAGLTIELARLQVELRRQLDEVGASRARIVQAGYDERRRLERDLHDGAQQRLVGLGIRLRRIQRSLPSEAQVLVPALDEAVDEIGLAIVDLRTIAAGLRPARLDDGLAAALDDLARHTPIPVRVDAIRERLSDTVETAAYYVACEAVTNAVKHAAPRSILVEASRRDGCVRVVVADDGVGGARPRDGGGGLSGLADRLHAQGGTLRVDSPHGRGTRVEAEIPCAS